MKIVLMAARLTISYSSYKVWFRLCTWFKDRNFNFWFRYIISRIPFYKAYKQKGDYVLKCDNYYFWVELLPITETLDGDNLPLNGFSKEINFDTGETKYDKRVETDNFWFTKSGEREIGYEWKDCKTDLKLPITIVSKKYGKIGKEEIRKIIRD